MMVVGSVAAPTGVGRRPRSPVLVGRDQELARVASALARPPAAVVVEGESGIGKTRLVSELPEHPELRGRRFLAGGCRRIREPFPLGPVLEAVRGLGGAPPAVPLSPVVGALRPLLPELAHLPPRPEPLDDRAAERHRLFRALAEVLGSLGPVVLVLEDLHWSDEQTIDFLSYLLGDPPDDLSLVVTQRSEDTTAEVRALTAKLPAPVTRAAATLRPLDAGQTATLAAALLGVDEVPPEFVTDLYALTSGSPYAIEELLMLLPERADGPSPLAELGVPAGIRDPVLERASRLPETARSVVQAAAVLQAPAGAPVLATICQLPVRQVRGAMTEALAAGVLVEQPGGVGPGGDTGGGAPREIGFRHLLAAQAVYRDLAGPWREELHGRAADALLATAMVGPGTAQVGPGTAQVAAAGLGQAAHHLRCAGRLAEWAGAAERAADHARALGHDDEAARLLEDVLPNAPLDLEARGRVAVKLARAEIASLRIRPGAGELLCRALESELPEPVRGELRLLTAVLLDRTRSELPLVRQLCTDAVGELADRPELQAWAMACLGVPLGPSVPVAEHAGWLRRALAVVPRIDGSDAQVGVLGNVTTSLLELGDPGWRPAYERLTARIRDVPGSRRAIVQRYSVGVAACHAGHHPVAERLLSDAAAAAAQRRNHRLELVVQVAQGLLDYCVGDWDGLAGRLEVRIGQFGICDTPGNLAVVRGCLALARGDLDGAAGWLAGPVGELRHGSGFGPAALATTGLIRIALARGDVAGALAHAERLTGAAAGKQLWAPLARALPALVQALLAADQADRARRLYERAAGALADRDLPLAPAALRHARGLLAAGPGAGVPDLLAAADRYARLGCRYEAAQAREQAAAGQLPAGDPAGARALLAAFETYRELGASWDLERVRRAARRHRVPVPRQHRGGRTAYGRQLSPREREVAGLAAVGRSDAEIAGELFLATSTVKKHLAAALRKLDVRSRAGLAHRLAHQPAAPEQ